MIRPNKKFGFTLAMPREGSTLRSRRARLLAKAFGVVRPDEGGFTLVELLIAAGISVVIVLLLGTMLGSILNTSSRANQRIDAFRDARAALQMMERDLSNLVRTQWNPDPFPSPAPLPCAASTTSTTFVTRPAAYFVAANVWQDPNDPYSTSTSNPNGQIFALISRKAASSATSSSPSPTPTPTPSPSAGDVSAVGYYCRWDGNRYTLRRFFRDSTATFAVLQNAVGYAADSDLFAPAANDEVLAAYVWNFSVAIYDASGNRYTTYPCICDQSATTPTLLPAAIEISFNAMSPQAARTVMSVSSSPADWMNMNVNLVKPHTYQFRTRINFQ
jgi:type II secretory pathway pseudopilin PulG